MRTYGNIALQDNRFIIEAEPQVIIKLKRNFRKVSNQLGRISLTATRENCRDLLWFFDRYPLEAAPDAAQLLATRAQAQRDHEALVQRLLNREEVPRSYDLALPARDYQRVAADIVLASGGLLCADDVGLGKTLVGIAMLTDGAARPGLVVTLTHLVEQWRDAINQFAPQLRPYVIKGGSPYSCLARDRAMVFGVSEATSNPQAMIEATLPDVFILNYHKLAGWADTLAKFIKSVTYDEAQELRCTDSQKYRAARMISDAADKRLGLTATPIYNYGGEIYSVIDAIHPGALGTWEEFSTEWCSYSRDRKKARISNPAAFGIHVRDAGLMIRRTREEVGRELPGLTSVPEIIECDNEALDAVETPARKLAEIILAQGAQRRGAQMQAAEELSNLLRQATGIAKAPYVAAFVRMLVESGKKVVLYGWHRSVYNIWLEALADLHPAMFTGSETPAQKTLSKHRFIHHETDLFIISLRAGAGLDGLQQVCNTVVFGELDWSPGVHEQCCGRVYRDGQPDPCMAYYLLANHGADPIMSDVLGVKKAQAHGVRDPNAPLVEKLQATGDHIKRLAESYLSGGRSSSTASSLTPKVDP